MDEEDVAVEEKPRKASKLPLVAGVVLAILGGGGGYFAVSSGLLSGSDEKKEEEVAEKSDKAGKDGLNVAFVELEPLTVSLGPKAANKHLRFRAQLEVTPEYSEEVAQLSPRIVDVMNTYLRAVRPSDFEEYGSLQRIRSHLLRRIQIVTGDDKVRDLLVMEFVLT